MKRAILLVSFGTSHLDTKEKTLDVLVREMGEAFPDRIVYCAWTSKIILKKIRERDGIHIFNVKEAMEQMALDGVEELVVQPTHFINGIENDQMREEVLDYSDRFGKISFGDPLLTSTEDNEKVIHAAMQPYANQKDAAIVWMGHGTPHYANHVYAALDYMMKDLGYVNSYMGTVEAYPSLDQLVEQLKKSGWHKVILVPFMMVAGDHAKNDMAGDEEDSWKSIFESTGYEVVCHLAGLGENPAIRQIFMEHARVAM